MLLCLDHPGGCALEVRIQFADIEKYIPDRSSTHGVTLDLLEFSLHIFFFFEIGIWYLKIQDQMHEVTLLLLCGKGSHKYHTILKWVSLGCFKIIT